MNGYAYFNSDKLALRGDAGPARLGARGAGMYRIVRELAQAARQPMPRLYISPHGRAERLRDGPQPPPRRRLRHHRPADLLNERELRAVLGHELSHVYNRDILISSVAGALAAMIGFPGEHGDVRGPVRRLGRRPAEPDRRS
jgi:heat shock protein HtpX